MSTMFCFQCEQTAKGTGCTVSGICGKTPDIANLQDKLTGELIGLARAADGNEPSESTHKAVVDGLFATITNVNFDDTALRGLIETVRREKEKLIPRCGDCGTPCPRNDRYDMSEVWNDNEDIRSLKSLILFGLRGMAAYAHHASALGKSDSEVNGFFYRSLRAIGESATVDGLLAIAMELGTVNLRCMELLDTANTESYGQPVPVQVPMSIEKGPFIVVSGHDLHDLKMLLEQTDGKGVNIYTHGEMLPAHGYPELKKHPQLKGNFGTAWQSQQKEFENIPAPVLFTTNCLMAPKPDYADRIYTTSVVAYPELKHIDADERGHKDFTALIDHAIRLGGYPEEQRRTGINGGAAVMTGFGRQTVLDNAPAIIDAVKAGAIQHFFLVGGCDGAKPGRSYYTEFVRQAPNNTVILTLACGKYRFNDLDAGSIGPFPRILDMGQCNDAYGAVQVALALAGAFNCGANDLPLTLVLSWYEQKAVCILLTLLSLGIRNILIGPSIPAFFSAAVLDTIVKTFGLQPISTPEQDLARSLNRI